MSLCTSCGGRQPAVCVFPNPNTDRPLTPDGGCVTLPGLRFADGGGSGEVCEVGLCDTVTVNPPLALTCDPDGGAAFTVELGCGLTTDNDGALTTAAQTLHLFDSGLNLVVNATGAFVATVVPVATVLHDCASAAAAQGCLAVEQDAGGIRVLRDGIYTVQSYSRTPGVIEGGALSLTRYRHRIRLNGAVGPTLWPGPSLNLQELCAPCALDGATGNTSTTTCLTANDLIQIEVATDSFAVEPIIVASAGLVVTYHGETF